MHGDVTASSNHNVVIPLLADNNFWYI